MAEYGNNWGENMPYAFEADPKIRQYCTLCGSLIEDGASVDAREVYKLGELAYIEVAHESCADDPERAMAGSEKLP